MVIIGFKSGKEITVYGVLKSLKLNQMTGKVMSIEIENQTNEKLKWLDVESIDYVFEIDGWGGRRMKKFKFSYNYRGVDKWVIIKASNEEDAYRRFVFAYMHCDVEELQEEEEWKHYNSSLYYFL